VFSQRPRFQRLIFEILVRAEASESGQGSQKNGSHKTNSQKTWSHKTGSRSVRNKTSRRRKPTIGVTGSIGAGKTAVSHFFGEWGGLVIDSDRISHAVLQSPEVKSILLGWWGESILAGDGSVDRRAVADRVFEHPAELARLEGVLYPRINARREVLMGEGEANPAVRAMVIDAPKLIEAGLHRTCDAVVVVDAPEALRIQRVATRGWSATELKRRENLLEPLDKKREMADHVIDNKDGLTELRLQAEKVFAAILGDFTAKHS
jgi:dephospho-CoA kinase